MMPRGHRAAALNVRSGVSLQLAKSGPRDYQEVEQQKYNLVELVSRMYGSTR